MSNAKWTNESDDDDVAGADNRRKSPDRSQARSQTQQAKARYGKVAGRRSGVGKKGLHRRRVRSIQW
ncbi:MAG: hypothetical protein GTO53_13130 [Planctomycetales bacterium]|nr:hypothetical protein [Planctomycetales bacterium]NIM10041.1 hypothetical protein [Planctomycetales bacterium]NIN09482.1 hypothetical protein [Planctomycetales bacterium]NIN78590.1 hypothetical protein [Planctomycetales bacterium]NIO35784.1 hypothetical protein [Planctomycetales bacterium]